MVALYIKAFVALFAVDSPHINSLSPHEALKAGMKLKNILSAATSIESTHIVTFGDLRDDIRNELLYEPDVTGIPVS